MKNRITASALVAAAALAVCSPAAAAPVTVNLRVEGASSTIFEGPVTTDGKTLDKGDGPHPCDGTNAGANPTPGPTMTSALDDASIAAGFTWDGTWFSFGDFLIDRIGPDSGTSSSYWGTVLNYQPTSLGGCQEQVHPGDEVLFAFGDVFSQPLLRLVGPARVPQGAPASVTVTNGGNGMPVVGARISGAPGSPLTGPDGSAQVTLAAAGVAHLKAERDGAIRSNEVDVCASPSGTEDCGVAPSQLGNISAPGPVHDSKAPVALISGPRDSGRYRRGPRLLRGTARDEVGVSVVKLALRRHVRGHCRWWSGRRERFVGSNCHKKFFFGIDADASWSYLLPKPLPPGRYVLDVKAFDRARNRDERFTRGSNRVVFEVAGHGSATGARAARGRGAEVRVLVDGRDRTLAGPRLVRARAARLAVGGRRCAVGAGTPLAALAAALRRSGLGYHLRDFGRCSARRAADSAQLFVDRIGPDANAGANGWVYKVGRRAGTAGSADPSGPFGSGRLRGGERLLWFYCLLNERAGSCQRTLELRPGPPGGRQGQRLRVRVRAFDDDGRGGAQEGATVTLGPASATTGASGEADLTLPAAGRYLLRASAPGTVAAFPVSVTVGRTR